MLSLSGAQTAKFQRFIVRNMLRLGLKLPNSWGLRSDVYSIKIKAKTAKF